MSLAELHEVWAWVMIVANGAVGAWALAAHRWQALRHRLLWPATAVAQVTVFVQVILGVYMVSARDIEVDRFHIFYGFLAPIAVAIIYSYRQQIRQHLYLLYGLGGLFVMGLGLRAIQVGAR